MLARSGGYLARKWPPLNQLILPARPTVSVNLMLRGASMK